MEEYFDKEQQQSESRVSESEEKFDHNHTLIKKKSFNLNLTFDLTWLTSAVELPPPHLSVFQTRLRNPYYVCLKKQNHPLALIKSTSWPADRTVGLSADRYHTWQTRLVFSPKTLITTYLLMSDDVVFTVREFDVWDTLQTETSYGRKRISV